MVMAQYRGSVAGRSVRVATPVFDSRGERRGLVIVNLLAGQVLQTVQETMMQARGEAMMLNAEGYWLLAPAPYQEWGHMVSGARDQRMGYVHPEVWATMRRGGAGRVSTEAGLFSFVSVDPLAASSGPSADPLAVPAQRNRHRWYLASLVPAAQISAMGAKLLVQVVTAGAFVIMLMAAIYQEIIIAQQDRQQHRVRLERLARLDPLTGVENRAGFEERLTIEHERASRWGGSERFALLYIDLDGFKAINDRFGHQVGDRVLKDIAQTLKARSRKDDVVGRYGGDEFVLILADLPTTETARAIAEDVREHIAALSWVGQTVGASIGVAVYPDHASQLQELLRLADQAMYAAKLQGRNCVCFAKPRDPIEPRGECAWRVRPRCAAHAVPAPESALSRRPSTPPRPAPANPANPAFARSAST